VKVKARLVSLECPCQEEGCTLEDLLSIEDYSARDYFQELNDKLLTETIRNNGLTDKEKYILSLCSQGLTTREMGKKIGVSHVRVVKLMAVIREKCGKYIDKV